MVWVKNKKLIKAVKWTNQGILVMYILYGYTQILLMQQCVPKYLNVHWINLKENHV